MRIEQIFLRNVRSHSESLFELEPGLVLFLGPNGVGKTSILMGLAWALFDHLPMRRADFIRYGQDEAQVEVRFRHRSKTWVVERSTKGSYKLFDGTAPVAKGKGDVTTYLRDVLGLVPGTSLPVFYGDAIGVPQGQLTAGLVLSPTARVDYWAKILGLDSYRKAWKSLLAPKSLLDMRVSKAEATLAGIESTLGVLLEGLSKDPSVVLREAWESLKEHRASLEQRVIDADILYERVQVAIMDWEAQVTRLAEIREALPAELKTLDASRGIVSDLQVGIIVARGKLGFRTADELEQGLRGVVEGLVNARATLERVGALRVHLHIQVVEREKALAEAPALRVALVDTKLQVSALEQAHSEVITDLAKEASASLVVSGVQTGKCPVCDTMLTDEEVVHIVEVWEGEQPDRGKLLQEKVGLEKSLQRKRAEVGTILSTLEATPSPRELREFQEDLALKQEKAEKLLSQVSDFTIQQERLQVTLSQQRDAEKKLVSLEAQVAAAVTVVVHQESWIGTLEKQERELVVSMGPVPNMTAMQVARAERKVFRGELREADAELVRLENQVRQRAQVEDLQEKMQVVKAKKDKSVWAQGILKQCRQAISDVGPVVSRQAMAQLSRLLTRYWSAMGKGEPIAWAGDYALSVGGREFRQLSGGEQVASAVAARMAVAQWLANLEFLILDEPTVHLDEDSRAGLVEALSLLPLEQVLVVSHDDTFSTAASQVIQL